MVCMNNASSDRTSFLMGQPERRGCAPVATTRKPIRRNHLGWGYLLALAVVGLTACSSGQKKEAPPPSLSDQLPTTIPGLDPGTGAPVNAPTSDAWAIFVDSASGANAMEQARAKAVNVSRMLRRNDVTIRPHPRGAAIVVGSYKGPDEADAKRDLAAIQAMKVDGKPLFAGAYLTPPNAGDVGELPQYSLEAARKANGPGSLYTLQIGVYESPKPEEAKRAAEEAAKQLRREGEQAFYHHGRNRSMVTIGLFSSRDYDPQTGQMNPALVQLKQRYPDNLYNGRELLVSGRAQSSALVEVP